MKKAERLNQELFFLNEHPQFNLTDLMQHFDISKSTALRDIAALEELGVPLYVENGRYGGYKIVKNSLLPPIYFSERELFAIFFSLQLLKTVIDSPFTHSYEQIKTKLLKTIGEKQQEKISQADAYVQYEGIPQIAATENLEALFHSILKKNGVRFFYTRYQKTEKFILPIRLVILDGFWYCTGFDLTKKVWRTYRCDFIEIIETCTVDLPAFTAEEIKHAYLLQQQKERTLSFKVKTTPLGKEYFLKHQFQTMRLEETTSAIYIVGEISPTEWGFLCNYLMGFGDQIQIISPNELKTSYCELLKKMLENNSKM